MVAESIVDLSSVSGKVVDESIDPIKLDVLTIADQSSDQSTNQSIPAPTSCKKSRAFGLTVGVRVCCHGAPHPRRITKYDALAASKGLPTSINQSIEYYGSITRVGTASNGGWFEVALDGEKDRRVYFRRGSIKKLKPTKNKKQSTNQSTNQIIEQIVQAQPIYPPQGYTANTQQVNQYQKNPSINPSMNSSMIQSMNQPMNQSMNQSMNQQISHSVVDHVTFSCQKDSRQISPAINQSINQSNTSPLQLSINQSTNQVIRPVPSLISPTNRPNNQSINQSTNQSFSFPMSPVMIDSQCFSPRLTTAPMFNQSITAPTSTNQLINQFNNQSLNQNINQSFNQSINQSMPNWSLPAQPMVFSSTSAPGQFDPVVIFPLINQSINQSTNQTIIQSINQSMNPSIANFMSTPTSPASPISISSTSTIDTQRRASTGSLSFNYTANQPINQSINQSINHPMTYSLKPMSLVTESNNFSKPPIKVITPRAMRPNSAFTVVS